MKDEIATGSRLDRLFIDANLTLIDVGARSTPRRELRALARWSHLVAIEPDAEEAARLEEALRQWGWRAVTVIQAAAGSSRSATLHRTRNPGFASLIPPDLGVAGRYVTATHFDELDTIQVTTTPLDELAGAHDVQKATIVKIDTQGTELDILLSAPRLLERTTAVTVEAMFEPMYQDQPLFGDVDSELRSLGFRVADIELTRLRGNHYRSDVWSRRQAAWVHAHYVREPATIQSDLAADLLAAVLAYGFIDLALETVDCHLPEMSSELDKLAARRTRKLTKDLRPAGVERLLASFERA